MMIKVYLYKAFVYDLKGGNPAGIVYLKKPLSEETMQNIARTVGLSETVFILPSQKGDFLFRYFTPVQEVPLCGHATIAGWKWLYDEQMVKEGTFKQEIGKGVLSIEINASSLVFMDQWIPEFGDPVDEGAVAESIGISVQDFLPGYPPQKVSTGLPDIIVPLQSQAVLYNLTPDFKKIEAVSRKAESVGYHVFAPDQGPFDARCRNFAPAVGIKEEAATGTASGALAAYLFRYGKSEKKTFSFLQGEGMGEPSLIRVGLKGTPWHIKGVRVGGNAAFYDKVIVKV